MLPTYHWDNDQFQIETRMMRFASLYHAEMFQAWLRSLQYENDPFLCHWSVPMSIRNGRTNEIPHENSLTGRVEEYNRAGVYHGVIIEADFGIYTEEVIRRKIGT